MLPHLSQKSRTSTIPASENIHPLQEYFSNLRFQPPPKFPELDTEYSDEEGKNNPSDTHSQESEKVKGTELAHLMADHDFGEMLNRFFVVGHKNLRLLQSRIRNQRNLDDNMLLTITDLNAHKIQKLRNHYYQLQMAFFRTPKGKQYDTAL